MEQNTSGNAPLTTDLPTRDLGATNLANQPSFHQISLGPNPANNNQQTTNSQTSIDESDVYRFCVPKTASVRIEQGKWDDLYTNPCQIKRQMDCSVIRIYINTYPYCVQII